MADKRTADVKSKPTHNNRHTKSKPFKAIKQKLYLSLSETISANADLRAFLQHRMAPKVISFDIIEDPRAKPTSEDGKSSSRVVLMFQSKSAAAKAVYVFHASNKNTTSKIHCFFTSEEEQGRTTEAKEMVESRFNKHMKEIYESAKSALDSHEKKIREANDGLSLIQRTLGESRGLSLDEHEKLFSEQGAREDKLNELLLQRKEFQFFLTSLKNKLQTVKFDPSYEAKLRDLRKNLGIECNRLKCALPMYARRSDILNVVEKHQVCVILGETGSGKSTQMAQYLFQAGIANKGMIACTQPRKIAAVSLATHVASEMASSVGQAVGYQVGLQKRKSGVTKVLYMTDHVLLNECLKDGNLTEYSCLIIDEAHERSIYTDLLLGMIKTCLQNRPDLKVIVTSATIDPGVFVKYYGGPDVCPILRVSGRTFPVSVFFAEDDELQPFPEQHEDKAVKKAVEIHSQFPVADGDILVFLTSPLETERSCERFQNSVSDRNYKCMQLHGKLQAEEQKLVFDPPPPGCRKIVFATNSAETSITIPGIKFVIDTGLAKEMRYNPKRNMNSLSIFPVSKSSAEQRKGRAGRMAPGKCYRLFSEKDFAEMEPNTKPEILRVHLGQALLKLLELGVNPLEFDFVESPPKDSLRIAMKSLEDINAVSDGVITELGKWVAKLPLEPQLGVLVKNGIDKDVPIEAMVLAACCCSSGMFFRNGTDEEKKAADLRKTKFCHPGGDLLTMLNVFREWHKFGEKDKGKWCKGNSINGKAMKGVRETVNEVLTVLRRDTKLDIKFILKPSEHIDELLQGLVIKCMRNNLCCFLGHEQAGYMTTKQLHNVNIHPSSSMKSLGQTPRLLVYWQLLQTSRTFITNLTPVDEELLQKLNLGFSLDMNEEELKRRYVHLIQKIQVGNAVFRRFVGPMHKNRRAKEEEIQQLCDNSIVIIDAKRDLGEIHLFCNQTFSDLAQESLIREINQLKDPFKNQTTEVHLGKMESGTRAVLGSGGAVKDILMPNQFRVVKIKLDETKGALSETDLNRCLSLVGNVEELIQFKRKAESLGVFWGKATFCSHKIACKAVQHFRDKKESGITLVPVTFHGGMKKGTSFTLKFTWVRRSSKGFGYVNLERPDDLPAILTRNTICVDGSNVSVTVSKRGILYLKGFNYDVTEEAVINALSEILDVEPDRSRFQVILPRNEAVGTEDPQLVIKREIQKLINIQDDSYKITVREIKPKSVKGMAFVAFAEADGFHYVASTLTQGAHMYLNGNAVSVTIDLKSSIHITKRVYEATKIDIESYIQEVANNIQATTITVKQIKSGNVLIEICASSTTNMASAKVGVHKIVDGDQLECERNETISKLFTRDARQYLKKLEEELKSIITVDDRTMIVHVQGTLQAKTMTFVRINGYLETMAKASEKEILLKGKNNPVGLMKALLVKYGTDLEKMKDECGLLSVTLKHRYHSILFTGEATSIEKATKLVDEIKHQLLVNDSKQKGDLCLPECPICLCEIDTEELIRLEYCGHAYCQPCLKSQMLSAVQDKQFPVLCAAEECSSPIVLQDIRQQTDKGMVKMKPLAAAAVSCFIGKNQKSFRYCITPDCDMIYRVSDDGHQFTCSGCGTRLCTTCHIQFHDGLTCAMFQSAKTGEGNVEMWIKDKPNARKKCPKCKVGIEKIDGCNHMTCLACHSHICWVCLAYFSTSRECYGHLSSNHNSFV